MDESLEQTLRSIDAERFEQYRVRCEESIAAAAAYRPSPVAASTTLLFAAQDNPDPEQWRPLVLGPVAVEHVPVAHHLMGSDDSMTMMARLINRSTGDTGEAHDEV
jgi:hypothetical protein